jgi:bidirectional [NiFe] hydrogenase diaphorase subunit
MAPPDPEVPGLSWERLDLGHPFFALQQPLVLEHCGWIDPDSIADALAHGAYGQLQRCRSQLRADQVRATIRRSGLRGRGGAGYPTGLKWTRWPCNLRAPVLWSAMPMRAIRAPSWIAACWRVIPIACWKAWRLPLSPWGAERGYVYLRAEYPLAIARLRRALEQANAMGILGRNAGLELELRVGAGAYVCGEETALLQSIQGQRGQPRPRPPFPAQAGLWGAPTLINNVETLAAVPPILRRGAEWFAAMGTDTSKGTKVFSLSGAVRHTGLVEVPMGTSLRTVVETMGGGVREEPGSPGGGVKAVQTGGPSGGCIPASLL